MSPNSILEINKGTIILSLEFLTKIPKIKPLKESSSAKPINKVAPMARKIYEAGACFPIARTKPAKNMTKGRMSIPNAFFQLYHLNSNF